MMTMSRILLYITEHVGKHSKGFGPIKNLDTFPSITLKTQKNCLNTVKILDSHSNQLIDYSFQI